MTQMQLFLLWKVALGSVEALHIGKTAERDFWRDSTAEIQREREEKQSDRDLLTDKKP
jgi:hypothetical protein